MSENNLVSIIMPAYNAELYIALAIESILGQTYQQWELLVVNDASSDRTQNIVEELQKKDARIFLLTNKTNSGIADSRNLALRNAKGRFIAFLDSDDLWLPEKLSTQVIFMTERSASISYSGYSRVNEKGAYLGSVRPPELIAYNDLLKTNHIGNLTGIYDCESLGKEYFKKFKHEDYIAWLNLIKRAGYAYGLPKELAQYRVYAGSASSNKFKTINWQWRIYRDSEHISLLRSCFLMGSYIWNAVLKRM
ncbi:MAG: glycosyltransferase family A protein [Pseudomonadota bacterium]